MSRDKRTGARVARRTRKALGALFCVVVFAVSCGEDRTPIRIGLAGPFRFATIVDNQYGAELAIAEANAHGGINGRPLEASLGEDGGNGGAAVRIAERYVKDPSVVAVIGHMSSQTTLLAAPLYDGHLAAVATMASSPELTNISPWVFRIAASDAVLGADLARFAISKHWRHVAILYLNDSYGRAFSLAFERALIADGGLAILNDAITPVAKDTSDYRVFVRTYAKRRPDAIVLVTSPGIGTDFLHAAASARLNIPIIGSDGWSPERLATDAAAEGVYIPSSFLADNRDSVANGFRRRFRARYGHEPDMYGATGYDAALVVIAAIRRAGPDRERVRDAIASHATSPVRGATGPISFISGDRVPRFGGLVRIEGGKVRTYLHWQDVSARPRAEPARR